MAKSKRITMFVCSSCGEEYVQWQGKCTTCGEWNTLSEVTLSENRYDSVKGAAPRAALTTLGSVASSSVARTSTGFPELDRVLGGGLVPGVVILLGGDPGIGKSTVLIQVAERVGGSVLYLSGEESAEQIKLRASRLGVQGEAITILPATDISQLADAVEQVKPKLIIIDSIQTTYDPAFPSTPGSLVQVRETALRIQQLAKRLHIPTVLVGHITKEGTVAGPRTLEHLVDVVLYLEGDSNHQLRILRAAKNRFGDANETGLFEMTGEGLVEVSNPTSFLLEERVPAAGSVLSVVLEGSRPMLVEVQALVVPSTFGTPRRTANGLDVTRLHVLLAVLQRRAGIDLSTHDVYINIVGGLKVREPAIDAAICVALASARQETVLPAEMVIVGEVGLSGELRRVSQADRRAKAVTQLGYRLVSGHQSIEQLLSATVTPRKQRR
jgi:DNA repair protein RadA/Sms